jgi:hypothetical protein
MGRPVAALNLVQSTQAARADSNPFWMTGDHNECFLEVWNPTTISMTLRMADVMAELWPLATHFADCHVTPLFRIARPMGREFAPNT